MRPVRQESSLGREAREKGKITPRSGQQPNNSFSPGSGRLDRSSSFHGAAALKILQDCCRCYRNPRLHHRIINRWPLATDVTPEKFCRVEDQSETWQRVGELGENRCSSAGATCHVIGGHSGRSEHFSFFRSRSLFGNERPFQ